MADVPGKFYRATKVRTGVAPSSAGSIEGEVLPPVNPPGSSLNSVGLTMPSAFNVSNSPLTANGTIGVTGAGTVAQYIRGDGSLADFPESSGGGSSVSYYLNGSVDQGTIGGIAYKELSKVPILGVGTDFSINADGYIASFITDAGDPSLLEIPGGNWNFETYFSASSSGGSPTFYVELYKVSSGGTATLIASSSSSPELIAFGTNLNPYFSTLAVPTTTLALTDRLAVRYYVTHSGRTITLHTENNHLCQIVTTFTTGITALNGLTAQVQNFAVGTTGTDFNIASATATHTFNLPTASATNRGALSSADWSLFTQAYNDKINSAAVTGTTTKTLTLTQQDGGTITASWSDLNTDAVLSVFGRTGAVVAANGDYTTAQVTESGNLYYTDARSRAALSFAAGSGAYNTSTGVITIPTNNNQITNGAGYITSAALAGYLPLSGGVMTGPITTPNGTFGIIIGDDSRLADRNIANTLFLEGVQNNDRGYINFSQTTGNALGAINGGDLTWRGNAVLTGTGTTNYLPKFTGSTTIGNSIVQDNGTEVGIGLNPSSEFKLDVGFTSTNRSVLRLSSNAANRLAAITFYGNNVESGTIGYEGGSEIVGGGVQGDLVIRNNLNKNIVLTGNNVLVGTTSDNGARLQVSGTATVSGSLTANGNLFLANDGTYGSSYITLGFGGTSNGSNRIFAGTSSSVDGIFIAAATGRPISFRAGGGTTDNLIIASTGAATFSSSVTAASIASNNGGFRLKESSQTSSRNWIIGNDWLVYGDLAIGQSTTQTSLSYTYPIYINPSGNVGIGTTTDNGARLQVSGDVTIINSDARLRGGDVTGRLVVGNSATSTYGIFYGSAHASVPNTIVFATNSAQALLIGSNQAATFSSSVTAVTNLRVNSTGASGSAYSAVLINSPVVTWNLVNDDNGGSGDLRFYNDSLASDAIRIKRSNNNVLIGTSTDNGHKLAINAGGTSGLRIDVNSGVNGISMSPGAEFNIDKPGVGGGTFKINSSGNVGIGTPSPNRLLHLSSASDVYMQVDRGGITSLFGTDNLGTYVGQQGNNILRFITNATEQMRITSSGNLEMSAASDITFGGSGKGIYLSRAGLGPRASLTTRGNTTWVDVANSSDWSGVTLAASGGNVLIGTTVNDGSKLRVVGNSSFFGTSIINSSTRNVLYLFGTVADNNYSDALYLNEESGQATGRQAISWYNANQNYFKARIWTQVGAGYGATLFGIDVANDSRSVDTRLAIRNGNVLVNTTTSTGATLEVNGTIRTGTLDTGYVSGFWKLGRAVIGTQPTNTHQIIVEINGQLYVIPAASL